jgi:hypothetical protein
MNVVFAPILQGQMNMDHPILVIVHANCAKVQ